MRQESAMACMGEKRDSCRGFVWKFWRK